MPRRVAATGGAGTAPPLAVAPDGWSAGAAHPGLPWEPEAAVAERYRG
ncbi:hypothetical protein [Streptomyces sp. TLI_171]|nr:hypothetical protein [Streptomyces sp. TLI_171]